MLPFMRRVLLFALLFACNTDSFDSDAGDDASPDSIVGGGGDGSTDAPTKDVVTKPKRFCETANAQFCADFDIPDDAGAGFAPPNTDGGWTLSFQGAQTADASPMAVSVVTLADAAGVATIDNPNLAFTTSTPGPSTKLVVEADVLLTNKGLIPDPITVFSAGVVPAPALSFGLAMQSNQWKLVVRGGGGPAPLSPQPPLGQWLHAVLTIVIGTPGTVTLDVGGSTATLIVATGTDAGSTYPGYISVGGYDGFYPNGGLNYFVDNVVAHWQ